MAVPAIRRRAERYNPAADPEIRQAMVAMIEAVCPKDRTGYALAFTLRLLRNLADNSPGPAQRRICEAYIDAFVDQIPARIRATLDEVARVNGD